jgi:signal transduction histidine kinase
MLEVNSAHRIRLNKGNILKTWEERVRRIIPADSAERKLALINSLPEFLDRIADTLQICDADPTKPECKAVSREHGEQRAELGHYTLDELIQEYHILLAVLMEFLSKDAVPTETEQHVIRDAVFSGIRGAAQAFADKQLEESRAAANQAREAQQLRELFVNALAHDIRNPLSTALINAQILERGAIALDQQVKCASKISTCIRKAGKIIDDVLDANHMRAGETLHLKIKPCDLERIVIGALESLAAMNSAKVVINNGHHIQGYWDCDKVQRAVENLISNALKYGDEKSPVTVTLNEEGEYAKIAVHNLGNALKDEELPKLFQPHYRARAARQSVIGGYGLGLTLVKGFAEAHGGTVSVVSHKDDGTTFTLKLPKRALSANKKNQKK